MEYVFMLKFQLPVSDDSIDDVVERLGVAECADALVGLAQVVVSAWNSRAKRTRPYLLFSALCRT